MELKLVEEIERLYSKFGEYGVSVVFEINGEPYTGTFVRYNEDTLSWKMIDVARLWSPHKIRFAPDKQNAINDFFKEHYNVSDGDRYLMIYEEAVRVADERRLKKVIYNRVNNYGWNRSTAQSEPIRKKRKNDINRLYDVMESKGKVIHEAVTIEEAHKLLKLKRSTIRAYTGYKWREKVIKRGSGVYLTDTKKQQ